MTTEDEMIEAILPFWRHPPQRGTVAPSRAARMGHDGEVFDGWQALCAACAECPWTVGPWRQNWIDAAIDAWAHNTEGWPDARHPDPRAEPTWDELIQGPDSRRDVGEPKGTA